MEAWRQLEDHRADADLRRRVAPHRERPAAGAPGIRGAARCARRSDARDRLTENASIAWSKTGRGSHMPTPLAYRGIVYILANNGVLDAYEPSTGKEIYRQRLPLVGSGYSASPVAADGKIICRMKMARC